MGQNQREFFLGHVVCAIWKLPWLVLEGAVDDTTLLEGAMEDTTQIFNENRNLSSKHLQNQS